MFKEPKDKQKKLGKVRTYILFFKITTEREIKKVNFKKELINKRIEIRRSAKSFSCVRLFVTPWAAAYQAPLSMGFSRQEYWSGLPFPTPDIKHSWTNGGILKIE